MAPQPSKLYKINNNDANKSTGRGQNLVLAEAEEAPAREIRSGRRRQGSNGAKQPAGVKLSRPTSRIRM